MVKSGTVAGLRYKGATMYYVWTEGTCDNSTPSLWEACEWANEFASEGYTDVYVANAANELVYRAAK